MKKRRAFDLKLDIASAEATFKIEPTQEIDI